MTPNLHPFCAAIIHHLKNKEVEINCGDVRTSLKFADFDVNPKNIIKGKIVDAMGDCLIIMRNDSRIFLNAWSIKSIVPADDPLSMSEIYRDDEYGNKKK